MEGVKLLEEGDRLFTDRLPGRGSKFVAKKQVRGARSERAPVGTRLGDNLADARLVIGDLTLYGCSMWSTAAKPVLNTASHAACVCGLGCKDSRCGDRRHEQEQGRTKRPRSCQSSLCRTGHSAAILLQDLREVVTEF